METLKSRWQLVMVAVLVLLVAGIGTWMVVGGQDDDVTQPLPPSVTPSLPAEPPSPEGEPSSPESAAPVSIGATTTGENATTATDVPAECQEMGEGFVPERYTMTNPQVDADVISLGLDADGAIAAPPKNQPKTASWWNQGPLAGSEQGKVVLSIHTYRNGGAVGNEMYANGSNQLQAGDLITLYGTDGEVACYEFVEAKKVWVEDYDPDSDVMVDFEGDPLLTIIICWDHVAGTDDWDSRIFFYAKPVVA